MSLPIQHQTLIEQAATRETRVVKRKYGPFLVEALGMALALCVGFAYRRFLAHGAPFSIVFLAFLAFAVAAVFAMLLGKDSRRRSIFVGIEVIAILLFFYDLGVPDRLQYLTFTGIAVFALRMLGEMGSVAELDNALEIKFFKTVKPQLRRLITAAALCGVVLYLPYWDARGSFLTPEKFSPIFAFAISPVRSVYPELQFDGTFGAFAESLARLQLKADPEFLKLSPGARERAVAEAAERLIAGLTTTVDAEVSADESVSSAVYSFIVSSLEAWRKDFGNNFLLVWAAAVFLIVRTFGIVFYFFASAAAYLVYQSLLAANVIHITGESRYHQVVDFT